MAPNPMYSPHLNFAPTFKYFGREWGVNDYDEFLKALKRRGMSYQKWARNHGAAARVFNPVEQQVYSMFQPQLTAIDTERKNRQDYYKRLMGDLTGFTTALMGMLGGIGPAIGGAYSQGADTVRASGEGYGSVQDATMAANAAQGNEVLANIDAPEGQMLSGGESGDVLAGLGGWIPETLLRQQGGAYAEAAGQLPKTASIEAQLTMKDLLQQAQDEEDEFSSQVLSVLQGLPGARQELRDAQMDRVADQQDFALDQLKAERDWYMKQAYLALAQGDRERANQYLELANQRETRIQNEQAGLSPTGEVLPDYYRDAQGRIVPKGYKYNNKGILVRTKTPGSGGGKDTPADLAGADQKVVSQYQDDIDRYIKGNLIKENPRPPFNPILPSYEEAFQTLWARFKNLVKTAKGRTILKNAIIAALRAQGITKAPAGPRDETEGGARK